MGSEAILGMMPSGGMMGQGMMSGMMGGGMLIGWLIPLLVLAGLAVLFVWAVRNLGTRSRSDGSEDEALEIARRRYARGDIDREAFRRLRSELTT